MDRDRILSHASLKLISLRFNKLRKDVNIEKESALCVIHLFLHVV